VNRFSRALMIVLASSVVLLLDGVDGQPVHSGEYYKCVNAKGQIYFSNLACPSQSEKTETKQLRDPSEQEYIEARQREEEFKRIERAAQEVNAQREAGLERDRLFKQCLTEADERYRTRWDETCLFGGGAKGCLLNTDIAADYDQSHTAERNECYQRYPQH
jgi:hypothetical protein